VAKSILMNNNKFDAYNNTFLKRFLIYSTLLITIIVICISCKKEEKPPDPVKDFEGNTYQTVKIGTQIWMAENLKSLLYSDGTDIPLVSDSTGWKKLTSPGYCWYNNFDTAKNHFYGALYNGYTITTSKICPSGWHVPSNDEWKILNDFLADSVSGGGKLKAEGTAYWKSPNKGATNTSGFSALPSGFRYFGGSFTARFYYTGFWSSTENGTTDQWFMSLYYADSKISMGQVSKNQGLCIRCVKD
jgi:uncharacterized protein (TIGR02145 family)